MEPESLAKASRERDASKESAACWSSKAYVPSKREACPARSTHLTFPAAMEETGFDSNKEKLAASRIQAGVGWQGLSASA